MNSNQILDAAADTISSPRAQGQIHKQAYDGALRLMATIIAYRCSTREENYREWTEIEETLDHMIETKKASQAQEKGYLAKEYSPEE